MAEGKCLSVLGTGSDVGKSLLVAALCRIFNDAGISVAPFKSQNMSNNSFVTFDGKEMGRAQVVQAECARVIPAVEMNPLLLKPSGNCKSQVILNGKAVGVASSNEFRRDRSALFDKTMKSLNKLRKSFDLIVIEGAGSCAELNLKNFDIANFRTALACKAPVILIADIDRGGVFAQLIGTVSLLEKEERKLISGLVINKFRGDASLFNDGISLIEEKTGIPVLGLIPHFNGIEIDSEDSLMLEEAVDPKTILEEGKINIGVIRFPHISNFTDFAALSREPSVKLSYLREPVNLDRLHSVILPGSKNVRSDLKWLKKSGWANKLKEYASSGGNICGICGGYQMLGKSIKDPYGAEGRPGEVRGLGLLDVNTTMKKNKTLNRVTAEHIATGANVIGYEIHMGKTVLMKKAKPLFRITTERVDGAVNDKENVFGTYIHGLFDEPGYRVCFLKALAGESDICDFSGESFASFKERQYDMLAEHFRRHLKLDAIFELIKENKGKGAA